MYTFLSTCTQMVEENKGKQLSSTTHFLVRGLSVTWPRSVICQQLHFHLCCWLTVACHRQSCCLWAMTCHLWFVFCQKWLCPHFATRQVNINYRPLTGMFVLSWNARGGQTVSISHHSQKSQSHDFLQVCSTLTAYCYIYKGTFTYI